MSQIGECACESHWGTLWEIDGEFMRSLKRDVPGGFRDGRKKSGVLEMMIDKKHTKVNFKKINVFFTFIAKIEIFESMILF